jgi:hypothetical protein
MRLTICLTAALALAASSTPLLAKAAKATTPQVNHTTWAYVYKGKKTHLTIDADGNYIENTVSGKHIDHGTAAIKDGKLCFDSKMGQPEQCWTMKSIGVGHSFVSTSDKGQKLRVTRVNYVTLKMPG